MSQPPTLAHGSSFSCYRYCYCASRAGLVALVALLGCSEATGGDDGPPAEQTASLGLTLRDEAEASLDALSPTTILAPLGTTPCASPGSATDTDGDGVPDDATFLFTAPPCRFSGVRGGTIDLVGQLRLEDPAPQDAGFGFDAAITALRVSFTGPPAEASYSVTRNGLRSLSGSITGLQLVTDLQLIRTFSGHADAAVEQQWTVAFTPEAPLQINLPLPSGTLDVSGALGWTRGAESLTLVITTPVPLHYDAACGETQRIDTGELRAAGDFDGITGYVRLTWSECGEEPEVRFVVAAG